VDGNRFIRCSKRIIRSFTRCIIGGYSGDNKAERDEGGEEGSNADPGAIFWY
jgi:hypothetical protein